MAHDERVLSVPFSGQGNSLEPTAPEPEEQRRSRDPAQCVMTCRREPRWSSGVAIIPPAGNYEID